MHTSAPPIASAPVVGRVACSLTRGVLRLNTTIAKEFDNDYVTDKVLRTFMTEAFMRDLCLLGPIYYRRTRKEFVSFDLRDCDLLLVRCPAIPMERWEAIKAAEAL